MLNGRNFPVLVYKSEIWVELRCLGGALGALMAGAGEREVTQTSTRHTHVMLQHYIHNLLFRGWKIHAKFITLYSLKYLKSSH